MAWRLVLLVGLLLVEMDGVVGQFSAVGPSFFGNPQSAPLGTSSRVTSNTTSTSSGAGSLQGSKSSASSDDGSDSSRRDGSSGDSRSRGSSADSASGVSADESGSGSWSMSSGSSSSSLEYGCDCRSVRRVSLMGASDYCLAPNAPLSSKCGNVDLGESGACPTTGAQPCSMKGHVLANDSLCALDDKDETYKCVASKKDLEIQKHGGKKKKKSGRHHGSDSSTSTASPNLMVTARQAVAIVVCVAAGVMAVV